MPCSTSEVTELTYSYSIQIYLTVFRASHYPYTQTPSRLRRPHLLWRPERTLMLRAKASRQHTTDFKPRSTNRLSYCCSTLSCSTKKPGTKSPSLTHSSAEHTETWSKTSWWPGSQPMYLCVLGMKPSSRSGHSGFGFPSGKAKCSLILAPSS